MRATADFYAEQIGLCAAQAAAAGLDNQRAMYLRAQAAWQTLANAEAKALAGRTSRAATAAA